jgi:hypothetical protein
MSEREVSLDEDGHTSDWDRTGAIENAIDEVCEDGGIAWLTRGGRRVAAIVPADVAERGSYPLMQVNGETGKVTIVNCAHAAGDLRARSCPSCHSIGEPGKDKGCTDAWHGGWADAGPTEGGVSLSPADIRDIAAPAIRERLGVDPARWHDPA